MQIDRNYNVLDLFRGRVYLARMPRLSHDPHAKNQPHRHAERGRGAVSNADGRYERLQRDAFDDGWDNSIDNTMPIETIVLPEWPKTIISRNKSPDISFDQSINPYRGCEHGCIYCYARPNHAYVGLSPGLDFETKLFFKQDAPALLEREFAKASYRPRTIMLGGVTDIYQPIERTYRITRALLEVMAHWRHPAAMITKSQLIMRDIDVIAPMAERNLAKAAISITTLDRRIARKMEPRAAAPHRRLEAVRALSNAGVPVAVMVAPIIPALNDNEIETILAAAADAGAREAGYVLLRMPLEIKELFREWLDAHFPDRAAKVIAQVRDMRGGRDYDPEWSQRQRGKGPLAELIAQRFAQACRRYGLNGARAVLDHTQFQRPGGQNGQGELFGG